MNPALTPHETRLLAAIAAALVLAAAGPHVAQPEHYHHFADQRLLWGLPCFGDVLSNLAFAAVAIPGAFRLAQAQLDRVQRTLGALACTGLLLTAAGSTWYHWQPDAAGLLADRLAMSVAFAGVLGLAACRVSRRAGGALAVFLLGAAPLALLGFDRTGNLLPWVVLQAGGLVLLVAMAWIEPGDTVPVRWGWVVAGYVVAKAFEVQDHAVWAATGALVSGHTLKHLVAALAVVPVIAAWQPAAHRQNRIDAAAQRA
jgi:hypothetical protein